MIIIRRQPGPDGKLPELPPVTIGEPITDPEELAQGRLVSEHFRRNHDWLMDHWDDLFPQAVGKHVAVAGQQAFVADTAEEALALAEAAHPEDRGVFVRYVLPQTGARIYAVRRCVAAVPRRCGPANDRGTRTRGRWDLVR